MKLLKRSAWGPFALRRKFCVQDLMCYRRETSTVLLPPIVLQMPCHAFSQQLAPLLFGTLAYSRSSQYQPGGGSLFQYIIKALKKYSEIVMEDLKGMG